MIKIIRDIFKQHYVKEINFRNDRAIKIKYYHEKKYKPTYLLNNNHIFYHNGYRTVLISDTKKETINPLELNSAYPVEKFKSAIETKVIQDTFNTLKTQKLDMLKLLLFGNIAIGLVILYYIVVGGK